MAKRGERSGHTGGLKPSGFFAFRAAALPISVITEWSAGVEAPTAAPGELEAAIERDGERLRERLEVIAGRPEVQGAISVASPDLLGAMHERSKDAGVEAAVVRYLTRMASRATPFGLFAGCGVGSIGERTSLELPTLRSWGRATRLDADYLDSLIRARASELREKLTLHPNDSLHLMGGRWHYVEARLDELERSHHLVEVADSEHLRRALHAAREGATIAQVADAVAKGGVDSDTAASYAEQLFDAQLLVSTLTVNITGALPLDAVIHDLEALQDNGTAAVLRSVRDELATIDAEGPAAPPGHHEWIAAQLHELPAPVEPARLLQVDETIPHCGAALAHSTVKDVIRAVELLRRIAPPRQQTELDSFRAAFRERYEGQEVPLLEALDEELGVGFGSGGERGDPSPLLAGLQLPARGERELPMGRRERRLLELLQHAAAEGAHEVSLTREDIVALERHDSPALPAALSATAVLARTAEGPRIVLTGSSGPSGAALLGRFCHADPKLAEQVRAHLRAEEALDADAIHAEIVHLPSGRMVNILARPVLRDYEIEWLGRSGAPPERRIPASDLLVSLRRDRFLLRSRTLGRRVVPRLTSAHNYSRRSPGVYRFLASVQFEGTSGGVAWSWSPLDGAPFRPRLRHGRLVFARASWRVDQSELRELDQRDPVARWRAVQAWRQRRRLPRWITVVDYDNVLAIDLDNVVSVDTFVRLVRRREEALVEELYPGPDELVAAGPDGPRAVELVVPLVREAPVAAASGERADAAAPLPEEAGEVGGLRRAFAPASEWSYLKLYTGSATADRLLREAIAPLARELVGSGAADRWFFLRYGDPGFHLRVRFHGDPGRVRPAIEALATNALDAGLAHEALLGTYKREIERYGGPEGMLVAERLFHADSDAVVDLLDMFEPGEPGLDERWRMGLLGADALMDDLGLDEPARAVQSRRMRDAFDREFRADRRLRKEIAEKLRAERQALEELPDAGEDDGHPLAPGVRVLVKRSERVTPLAAELARLRGAGRLTLPIDELAVSCVHMWLNRLCRSENRFHEYVIYALLARLHEARAARGRTSRPT